MNLSYINPILPYAISGGVEICNNHEKITYNAIIIKRVNNEYEVVNEIYQTTSLEKLSQTIEKTPVSISFTGTDILVRDRENEFDSFQSDLNEALPGAEFNEFFIQTKSEHFAIARRDFIINQLEMFRGQNIMISQLFLGPMGLANCLQYLDPPNRETGAYGNHYISFFNHEISEYLFSDYSKPQGKPLSFGDVLIPRKGLICFATAVSNHTPTTISSSEDFTTNDRVEIIQKKWHFVGLVAASLILLISISASLFAFLNVENKLLNTKKLVKDKSSTLGTINALKKEITSKRQLLQSAGIIENSRTSFFSDQIASSIPKGIRFKSMEIHPVASKRKNSLTQLSYKENEIEIEGDVLLSHQLNQWISTLKDMDWIDDVVLTNFISANNKKSASFNLTIKLDQSKNEL